MHALFDKLPTILVLAVLVATFLSLRRHVPSVRMQLWGLAWGLVFVHFFVQVLETRTGPIEQLIEAVDLSALELSGIVFVVSLSASVEERARRWAMLIVMGAPTVVHAFGATLGWRHAQAMAYVLELVFGSALLFLIASGPIRRPKVLLAAVIIAASIWAMIGQLRGNYAPGVDAILTLGFAIPGVLFWMKYRRFSVGVLCVSGGFLAWGAVSPAAALLHHFYSALTLNPEIWNVPKFFVAFGMILTLVEDKSLVIEENSAREHAENELLERFARVTSRLLSANDPVGLSQDIAQAITEVVGFRRAAIIAARENGSLFLAGAHGYTEHDEQLLREHTAESDLAMLDAMRSAGTPVCGKTFRLRHPVSDNSSDALAAAAANGEWSPGEHLIVPLISHHGSDLGWVLLSEPAGVTRALMPQIVRLELLAADLAAQIENTRLQRQLVRSEKLAGIGQLVAGVAHELNNPLTGIIGYSDILREEVKQESAHRRLTKLGEEARRMKRIIDSLLRFSRPNSSSVQFSQLAPALQDALQLREYFLRSRSIEIHSNIEPNLPSLAICDDELKQILLNVLSNAIDAVETVDERRIDIAAMRLDNHVVIRFDDSGPGFADLHRAFDAFFTTKPVGKGTGLGLSICYGLLKNIGGEIQVSNRAPHGASVILNIPLPAASPNGSLETLSVA